jgi:hypothetical protein
MRVLAIYQYNKKLFGSISLVLGLGTGNGTKPAVVQRNPLGETGGFRGAKRREPDRQLFRTFGAGKEVNVLSVPPFRMSNFIRQDLRSAPAAD